MFAAKIHDELSDPSIIASSWLTEWMQAHKINVWGAADLRDFPTPRDEMGQGFPFALSWAIPMDPQIMISIQSGPNQAYADEYARVNSHINELSVALAAEIGARGFRSKPLATSDRTTLCLAFVVQTALGERLFLRRDRKKDRMKVCRLPCAEEQYSEMGVQITWFVA